MDTKVIDLQKEIINRCKKGDEKAQYRLYSMYSKSMYNVAIRYVGIRMDAEDILQEAFISAFKNLKKLKEEQTFPSWLRRIVINKSISFLRKKKFTIEQLDDNTHIAEEEINSSVTPEILHRAIKKLPEGARIIINLFAFEGYKHKEIAKKLGITESTSKTQYLRAKKLLSELINQLVISHQVIGSLDH